ncbi:Decarbamoylnovobiocin carbamoyltransferase [Planctomycetes bacterium CA13]|uniref:Decarbamoylnovobiocin carbamoyltransferase n=1 Tax=Novipirellula herctigrandis TaxID=2527986 RepID=A0A5C5Z6H9_9BACT|nr:Decarbamoylnovobiocin carbamoyltransferase [Planctomycetes bacterium CA13]
MTLILGISAYYHDSAVALIQDGHPIAAASEERFSRKKHDASFPTLALKACLDHANVRIADIDYVGFYEKPLLKFDRLLETYLAYAPRGYRSFARAMPDWLQTKLHLPREIRKELGGDYRRRIVFCEHHQSHAASAFFPSPFPKAAILTIDGVGEWATTCWGIGSDHRFDLKQEIRFPHSLGLLYSAFTYFCGFRVNSGEYKLMGLAPYGKPRFASLFHEELVTLFDDGSYRLNMDFFDFCHKLRMTGRRLERLLGVPRRLPDTPVREVDMDIAASIQSVTEDIVLRMAGYVHQQTGLDSLCMAGGVALNCVSNGRLLREGPFKHIWVQPAAGDAGGALGIAWSIWHQMLGNHRVPCTQDSQQGSFLGPAIDQQNEIEALLHQGATAKHYTTEKELCSHVANLIANGHVVGWAQGRMEFGPRSLGNRSILGDPRNPEMQTTMNLKIKYRESFRPFAPSVLRERAHDHFQVEPNSDQPYMLFTSFVNPEKRIEQDQSFVGVERVRHPRSDLPAITHLDYSARVQTVDPERHPRYHALITEFYHQTGCPVLINTSFNVRGEPIVQSAADAYRCFMATEMDVLVVGDHVFLKENQPEAMRKTSEHYLSALEPD